MAEKAIEGIILYTQTHNYYDCTIRIIVHSTAE